MKDKILVWVSPDIIHYFIAYGIQNNHDGEYYAIYDIPNETKKFFSKQNFIKFKEEWFFFDHIKKNDKKPNYDYLKKFEEKYKINLWKLAINERIFYRFFDFHKFTTDEIAAIVEQECRLFEKILDEVNPNYIITKDASRHHHELFFELCVSKGIKVLTLSQTNLGTKTMISQKSHTFDSKIDWKNIESNNRSLEELQIYIQKFNFLKSVKKNIDKKIPKLNMIKVMLNYLFSDTSKNREQYYYFGRTKFKVLLFMINSFFNRISRKKFIDQYLEKNPNCNESFVYFPIHVDMERPLLIMAPLYTNQIEIIRQVAKSLPMGLKLYVKETPASVTRDWRSISTYKEIMSIPNVTLIHPSVSAEKLMKNTSIVFTIAGTSGFEAAFYGKPSIVFSDVGYMELPSVTRVREIEELETVIRKAMKIKVNQIDLDKFVNYLEKNVIDFNWFEMESAIGEAFFFNGYTSDIEIKESQMKSFLEKNSKILDYVGKEHIKKFN
tara:strand:+ start:7579 stop:9063 length:1485 start_codon:yes stop_codon:yes gene_type:complete